MYLRIFIILATISFVITNAYFAKIVNIFVLVQEKRKICTKALHGTYSYKALSIERKEVSLRSEIFAIIPTIIYINIRWSAV